MYAYPVLVYNGDDGAEYEAVVPDLPGCTAGGETLSDVLARTRDAVHEHLKTILMDGKLAPEPSDLEQVRSSLEFGEPVAYAAVEIDINKVSTDTERVNVSLPKWLIASIDSSESNRSRFLADSAVKALQAKQREGRSDPDPQATTSPEALEQLSEPSHLDSSTRYNWMAQLPDDVQRSIRDRMHRRRVRDGATLFRAGEWDGSLFQIVEGSVHLTASSRSGQEALFSVHRAGSCIGVTTSVCRLEHVYDAVAQGELTVDCLSQSDFRAFRDQHPEIDRAIAEWGAHRIWELMQLILRDTTAGLPGRLASHVDYLLDLPGTLSDSAGAPHLDVSHATLAGAVGASRQAVSKILKEWRRMGVIDYRYGRMQVLDRARLTKLCET